MIVYIKNSYCSWVHLLQILVITRIWSQIKERGLYCWFFTKSLFCVGISKRRTNGNEWNGPLLLNANYVLQETRQTLFLPSEPCCQY